MRPRVVVLGFQWVSECLRCIYTSDTKRPLVVLK